MTLPSLVTDEGPCVPCVNWNDWGTGWEDLCDYGFPGNLRCTRRSSARGRPGPAGDVDSHQDALQVGPARAAPSRNGSARANPQRWLV